MTLCETSHNSHLYGGNMPFVVIFFLLITNNTSFECNYFGSVFRANKYFTLGTSIRLLLFSLFLMHRKHLFLFFDCLSTSADGSTPISWSWFSAPCRGVCRHHIICIPQIITVMGILAFYRFIIIRNYIIFYFRITIRDQVFFTGIRLFHQLAP